MTQETKVVCDFCGSEGKITDNPKLNKNGNLTRSIEPTVHKWFRLARIDLYYRTKSSGQIPEKNNLDIRDEDDPDFCKIECLLAWMEREAKKITRRW